MNIRPWLVGAVAFVIAIGTGAASSPQAVNSGQQAPSFREKIVRRLETFRGPEAAAKRALAR